MSQAESNVARQVVRKNNGRPPPPISGRFKKGNPGSPGRPKLAQCIPDILRVIGDEAVPEALLAKLQSMWGPDFRPKNMRDALLRTTYAQATEGDEHARQFVVERTEGKVTDKVQVEDTTPREVVFKEVRLGDISETTATVKRPAAEGTPAA
jgi:hypothetical protein